MFTHRYFVIYKPFGILSQFSGNKNTLKDLFDFPKDVYPIGRLDKDSEGLLLITDDKALNHHLLNPKFGHLRTYLAQVEGIPASADLLKLEKGVEISVEGNPYLTKNAKSKLITEAPALPDRNPPIRNRKNVPDSWIELSLTEGKNRQVRKMTAAIGFPTLRLVRWSMENLTIAGYDSGEVRGYLAEDLYPLLKLDPRKIFQKEKPSTQKSFTNISVSKRKL